MTKKEIGILAILGIFVVGLVVFGVITQNEREKMATNLNEIETEKPVGEAPLPPEGKEFIPDVPKNIVETTPDAEAPAAPGSSAKLGLYDIQISEDGFVPNQIVVKKGNVVQAEIKSVDGKYDFTIPYLEMGVVVNKGETKQMTFRVDATGTFSFECKDFCPPQGKIRGVLVVKE